MTKKENGSTNPPLLFKTDTPQIFPCGDIMETTNVENDDGTITVTIRNIDDPTGTNLSYVVHSEDLA